MDAPLSTWNWFLPHNALWVAILKGYKIGLAYLDNQKVLKRLPRSDTIHELYCTCSNKKTLIKIVSAIRMNFLNIRSSSNVRVPHIFWTKPKYPLFISVYPCLLVESHFVGWNLLNWLGFCIRIIDPSDPRKSIEIQGSAIAPGLAEQPLSAAARSPGICRHETSHDGLWWTAMLQDNQAKPSKAADLGSVWCWRMPTFQQENKYKCKSHRSSARWLNNNRRLVRRWFYVQKGVEIIDK